LGYLRKLKRKQQQKDKKTFSKTLRKITTRMTMLGDQCASCDRPFDKQDPEQISTWSVYQNESGVSAVCPKCKEEIEKLKSEMAERETRFRGSRCLS